jgi:hypothetical protein
LGVLVPELLVFTVDSGPRHVDADRAMAALLGAFAFAPVVYRQSRGRVLTFHAEIPDLQLGHVPAAVAALSALDEVENVALVPLPGPAGGPAPPAARAWAGDASRAAERARRRP